MSGRELDRVREALRSRTVRTGNVVRVAVVIIMFGAVAAGGDSDRWTKHGMLLALYSLVALAVVALTFSPFGAAVTSEAAVKVLTAVDIGAVILFKQTSPGGYIPLLVMGLLPIAAGLGMSLRPLALALAAMFVAFTVELLRDPVMKTHLGWPQIALIIAIYGLLCALRLLAAAFRGRYETDIAAITASREELLADTMTASDAQRRGISESIHDGPLQDVLAARRDIADYRKVSPAAQLDRAVSSLDDASRRLRDATFELHPAVLDQVGLRAAVEKLAAMTAERSGVNVTVDVVDHQQQNGLEPMLFGLIRELLSNVVRHSGASQASVTLAVTDGVCRLDVADNGVGIAPDAATRRLAEGHIGLASQRTRVEAAGGHFAVIDEPVGAHIRVDLPLRG
jgi:two-component system NarL family sensor kinase